MQARIGRTTLLLTLALLVTGCASLGLGMDEKPQGPRERFIAAMVDYEILAHEATIVVEGWVTAVEQGDPLAPTYLKAAERIDQIRSRARSAIDSGLAALAQDPPSTSGLEAAVRVLNTVMADLQRELLAGRQTALAWKEPAWTR